MNEDIKSDSKNLIAFLSSEKYAESKDVLNSLPAYETALIIESSPPKKRALIWQLIEESKEGEILKNLSNDVRETVLTYMDPEEVAIVTKDLEPDEIADILQDLPEQIMKEVIEKMSYQNKDILERVLKYPEDSAGGLMNTDFIVVRPYHSVELVLRYLRIKNSIPLSTDNLFVVSRNNKFRGVLPISNLITSAPTENIKNIMVEKSALNAEIKSNEVIKIFERDDLISAPVIDEENNLIGRITFDDVIDKIKSDADVSLKQFSGLSGDTFEKTSVAIKTRGIWLGINLLTAIIASSVINLFKETIEEVIFLAVLMPIIASMGGVAATQTLTITVRGLALGQIMSTNYLYLLSREITVGVVNGFFWALVLGLISYFWFGELTITLIILLSMVINLFMAVISGMGIPILLKFFKLDPAIAGSVIVTTITDVVGFMSFLGLATIFYG
ncbi:MAG: magnesium transporter [Pseudomonadota bacterium]|nr:magnesium transporter [Pseudomonadota bacterium]